MSRIRILQSADSQAEVEIRPFPSERVMRWRSRYEDRPVQDRPDIFMTRAVYRDIDRHVRRTLKVEVGGLLLGHAYLSPSNTLYTVVQAHLEAESAHHGPTHLTFTSDTLTALLNHLENEHPDKQIVGWYHTHPGLSIFLSSLDQWLHTRFFPQFWHVALVIDPNNDQGGFFTYRQAVFAGNVSSKAPKNATTEKPSYLDPRRYIGFYELAEPGSHDIAVWRNLEGQELSYSDALSTSAMRPVGN